MQIGVIGQQDARGVGNESARACQECGPIHVGEAHVGDDRGYVCILGQHLQRLTGGSCRDEIVLTAELLK